MNRILAATAKGVRLFGLEGLRTQNIADLAGVTSGAIYRYFDSKDDLLRECFTRIEQQVADLLTGLFRRAQINPQNPQIDLGDGLWKIWQPYFRFWTARPDETVFYHRFRDSAFFSPYTKVRDESCFAEVLEIMRTFKDAVPGLKELDIDFLWLHLLTSSVMYAKYVVEGVLPNSEETELSVFHLLINGLIGYLQPDGNRTSPQSLPSDSPPISSG